MNIIKNHDPYYMTFAHDDMDKVIQLASSTETNDWNRERAFKREELSFELSQQILKLVPKARELTLNVSRVSVFMSRPGFYYRAHTDGMAKFGINYILTVKDSLCVTSWYDKAVAKEYDIDYLGGRSYELVGFKKENHVPLHATTLSGTDAILFNTGIIHDWDNSKSSNQRALLTLRPIDVNMTYEQAKEILFGK